MTLTLVPGCVLRRLSILLALSLACAFGALTLTHSPLLAAAPAETLTLRGTVTNTTHDMTAPAQLELTFTGDKISGFLTVEQPLHAGRWPVAGMRRGAWCEIGCVQAEKTRVTFRGVLGAERYRGTYSFIGDTVVTQYGQFDLTAATKH